MRVLQLLEQVGTDTAEKQVPGVRADPLGVVGEHDERGCAALRDRGAITNEEYPAEKTHVLSNGT